MVSKILNPLILILLISCSDHSIVDLDYENGVDRTIYRLFRDPEGLILQSVSPGQWFSPGDYLSLQWDGSIHRQAKDILELNLKKGEESHFFYRGSIAELPGFTLSSGNPQGEYSLQFKLFRKERLMAEGEVPVILFQGNYGMSDIELFPPLLTPGATITAYVDPVGTQPSADPWIIWRLKDQILQEKSLSQEGNWIQFQAPDLVGVFPLEVDIYPEKPRLWNGKSPFLESTELYLSRGNRSSFHRIWNSDYALFHLFDRSMDLDTLQGGEIPMKLENRYMVEYAVEENLTGAEFQRRSSLQFNGFALPLEEGRLSSHSQSFYILLDREASDQRETIFSSQSPADGLNFTLMILEEQLVASLGEEQSFHRLSFPLNDEDWSRPLMVTISLDVRGGSREMSGFLDGEYQGAVQWRTSGEQYLGEGETLFGSRAGSPGFLGVLYGWMIYRNWEQESYVMQENIYREMKEFHWGDRLILAEGFDSKNLSPPLVFKGEKIHIGQSKLTLFPGDILQTSEFPLFLGQTELVLQGEITEDPNIFLIVDKTERLRLSLENKRAIIQVRENRIERLDSQGDFEIIRYFERGTSPSVTLEISPQNEAVILDSIFMHR